MIDFFSVVCFDFLTVLMCGRFGGEEVSVFFCIGNFTYF